MQQVDAKAGVAHVELLQQDETPAEKAEEQPVDVAATAASASASTADAPTDGQGTTPAGDDGSRVFFLLKVRVNTGSRRKKIRQFCVEKLSLARRVAS